MPKVIVMNQVTLDGVMQGPGRPDEDTRDGFGHGGWAVPRSDELIQAKMGELMGENWALLLGRRSYEGMLSAWNARGGRFKDALNAATKYVASSSSTTTLEWPNSRLLHGDVPTAVADLRRNTPGNLVIMGSGQLIRSLLPHELIDEFLLMIHPLVLGTGQRLFEHDRHGITLRLVDCTATTTGVILATYQSPS